MMGCPHLLHGSVANGGKSPGINTFASHPGLLQVTSLSEGFSLTGYKLASISRWQNPAKLFLFAENGCYLVALLHRHVKA
jgi:hypothetical protein